MKKVSLIVLMLVVIVRSGQAQDFSSRVLADSLFIPWEMVYGPDDHIWFTQKNGHVCRLNPQNGQLDTVLSIPDNVVQGEGGLLGLAVGFTLIDDVHFYLAYQYLDGSDYFLMVKHFVYRTLSQSVIQEDTLIDRIPGANNHNGCRILLDNDLLYITTGDAEVSERAQDLNSLNGKILRIHTNGTIPSGNPLPGSPIWSWGHRNAQGLLLHNGNLYSSEHGPDTDDEINRIEGGRNYGWPEVKGYCDLPAEQQFCNDSAVVEPLHIWTPTIAPSDMIFYEGSMFPEWSGSVLLATLKGQQLLKLELNAAGDSIRNVTPIPGMDFGRLRDLCMAPDGRLFLSTSNSPSSGQDGYVDQIIEVYKEDTRISGIEEKRALLIYPNPASTNIRVKRSVELLPGPWTFRLTDMTGRLIRTAPFDSPEIAIDQLSPGVYFLQLEHAEKKQLRMGRFIKK